MNKKIFITAMMSSLFVFSSCSGGGNMSDVISDSKDSSISLSVEESLLETDSNGYIYVDSKYDGGVRYEHSDIYDYSGEKFVHELEKHINLLPKYETERQKEIKENGHYQVRSSELDASFIIGKVIKFTFTKKDIFKNDKYMMAFNFSINKSLKCFFDFIPPVIQQYDESDGHEIIMHPDFLNKTFKDDVVYSIIFKIGQNRSDYSDVEIEKAFDNSIIIELKEVR